MSTSADQYFRFNLPGQHQAYMGISGASPSQPSNEPWPKSVANTALSYKTSGSSSAEIFVDVTGVSTHSNNCAAVGCSYTYTVTFKHGFETTKMIKSQYFILKLKNYVMQSTTKPFNFDLKLKGYHKQGQCSSSNANKECTWLTDQTVNVAWPAIPTEDLDISAAVSRDLASTKAESKVAYDVRFTLPTTIYKGARILFTVTEGSVMAVLDGNKDYICNSGCVKGDFDTPTRIDDKTVALTLASSQNIPKGAVQLKVHFFKNPSANGDESFKITVQSVDDGATFKVASETFSGITFTQDLDFYTLAVDQSYVGIPTTLTYTWTSGSTASNEDNLQFWLYLPVASYHYMQSTVDYTATLYPPQANLNAMTFDFSYDGTSWNSGATITQTRLGTGNSIIRIKAVLGSSKTYAVGKPFIFKIHNFYMPISKQPIPHTGSLLQAQLLNVDPTRCPSDYSDEQKFNSCINDYIHLSPSVTLSAQSAGMSGGSAVALTTQHEIVEGQVGIYRLGFHVLNPFPAKDTIISVKGISLKLDPVNGVNNMSVKCVTKDFCVDALPTNTSPAAKITKSALYELVSFDITDFFKSPNNGYLDRATYIEFDIKGFWKVKPAYKNFLNFHVQLWSKDSLNAVHEIDEFIDFTIPLIERTGDIRLSLDEPSGTVTKDLGISVFINTLVMEIDIQAFVKEGSKILVQIPKSNLNMREYMSETVQNFIKQNQETTTDDDIKLIAAEFGGVDILSNGPNKKIDDTHSLTANAEDWTYDVYTIQLLPDAPLQLNDDEIQSYKVLKLTFEKYRPPQSTEPLGACKDSTLAAEVNEPLLGAASSVGRCFSVRFLFDWDSDGTSEEPFPALVSSRGLINKHPYFNNKPENTGTISVGQGDPGIIEAQFSYTFFADRAFPTTAFIDVILPVGFDYAKYKPADTSQFVQIGTNSESSELQTIGNNDANYKVIEQDFKGKLRVMGQFKTSAIAGTAKQYNMMITPNLIKDIGGTADKIMAAGQVGMELKKMVNTLQLPSQNYFWLRMGYEKTVDGKTEAYYIESYRIAINMEQPSFSKMELIPIAKGTADTVDREVGKIVKLRVDYKIQKPFKSWSVFEIKLPKDLLYYSNDGISPASAITTEDDLGLSQNIYTGINANTFEKGVTASGLLIWDEYTTITNGQGEQEEQSVAVQPLIYATYTTVQLPVADPPTSTNCDANCPKWYIYQGEAFDNDLLALDFNNDRTIVVTKTENGKNYRLKLRVELSYFRNPPSTKAILETLSASIRVPQNGSYSENKAAQGAEEKKQPVRTLSAEAVTPFLPDDTLEGGQKGLWASVGSPGKKLGVDPKTNLDRVSVEILVGQNEAKYTGAVYRFKMLTTNPIPKRGYMKIKANFDMWAEQTVPPQDYLRKIVDCEKGCRNIIKADGSFDKEAVKGNDLTELTIPNDFWSTLNIYREQEVQFVIYGLSTPDTLDADGKFINTDAVFTITTFFDANAAGQSPPLPIYQIDEYTDVTVQLKAPVNAFQVSTLASDVGGINSLNIAWTTEETMTIYKAVEVTVDGVKIKKSPSFIEMTMPKANLVYNTELDDLRSRCTGKPEKICCDLNSCQPDECCPEGAPSCTSASGAIVPPCSNKDDDCPCSADNRPAECPFQFYQKTKVGDFLPVPILLIPNNSGTELFVSVAAKPAADGSEQIDVNAKMDIAELADLYDDGYGCWAKKDTYRFRFENNGDRNIVIPAGSSLSLTVQQLKNPFYTYKLSGLNLDANAYNITDMWSLKFSQDISTKYRTNFAAFGPEVNERYPLKVIQEGASSGVFEKSAALDTLQDDTETFKIKLDSQNLLLKRTQLRITIPSSTSWVVPAVGEKFIECTNCRPEIMTWKIQAGNPDNTATNYKDVLYENQLDLYKLTMDTQGEFLTVNDAFGNPTKDYNGNLKVYTTLNQIASDLQQYQELVIEGLFDFFPGGQFTEGLSRAIDLRPNWTVELVIAGFKKPVIEACEQFAVYSMVSYVNPDATNEFQSYRIEYYDRIIFTYTSQDLQENRATGSGGEEDEECVLGAEEPKGIIYNIQDADYAAGTVTRYLYQQNFKQNKGLWKTIGNCRKKYRYRKWAQNKKGQQYPSQYVQFDEYTIGGDLAGMNATFTLNLNLPSLSEAQKNEAHAVYIQGFDMSTPDATNWICFTVVPKNAVEKTDICKNFCDIQRSQRNPTEEANILLDETQCTDSEYTNNKYSYETNNPKVCPLVQVISVKEGLYENFKDGQFLIRPSSLDLDLLEKSFFKKTTITGCSSGNSNSYDLYFYLTACRHLQVNPAIDQPVLQFNYDESGNSGTPDCDAIECQDFNEDQIGFQNSQPEKCPSHFYLQGKVSKTAHEYEVDEKIIHSKPRDDDPAYNVKTADALQVIEIKDKSGTETIFKVQSQYRDKFIRIELLKDPSKDSDKHLFSTEPFIFEIDVAAYADGLKGIPILMSSQKIKVEIKPCDSSCEKCDQVSFNTEYLTGLPPTATNTTERSIFWDNSFKCTKCKAKYQQRSQMVSDVLEDGSTRTRIDRLCIPEDENIRFAEKGGKSGKSAGWGQVHTFMQNSMLQKKCSDVIYKCSTCASATQCLKCDEEKTLLANEFQTKRKEKYLFCTNEINYRLSDSMGVVNPQDPKTACTTFPSNMCKYCSREKDESCYRCIFGKYTDGIKCKEIVDPIVEPTPLSLYGKKSMYFVKANGNIASIQDVKDRIDTVTQQLISTPVTSTGPVESKYNALDHILQVFFAISQDSKRLTSKANDAGDPYEVTVWLGKGDHHFYSCNVPDGQQVCPDPYCNQSIKSIYSGADHVIYHFKPLRSDSLSDEEMEQYYKEKNIASFYDKDKVRNAIEAMAVPVNEKPTIAVMDAEVNFNVTRGMTFEDIIFRGDYGMLKTETSSYVKSPRKFCSVDESTNLLTYNKIKLDKNANSVFKTSLGDDVTAQKAAYEAYECEQTYFQDAKVDTEETNIQNCEFIPKVGSVRSCSGEPYSDDYDTTITGVRVRFKRRKVLFNLFNYDLDFSRYNGDKEKPLVSLDLVNCEFRYFLKDYEALIYAETSIVEAVQTQFSDPYIVQSGDDRGMRLTITDSKFEHSSFCKGLIVYREMPELLPSVDNNYLVMNFKYEAEMQLGNWEDLSSQTNYGTDKKNWPFINIKNSLFKNLNHGQFIDMLSITDNPLLKKTTKIKSMPDNDRAKVIPYFDNHGAVLNLEGFPGKVSVKDSSIENNMYYIADVFPTYRETKGTETPWRTFYSDDADNSQMYMVKCQVDSSKMRFFGDYLASTREQDAKMLSQLEKFSAIYISKPSWPVYLTGNKFQGNVGVFGGAISINQPAFKNATEYRERLQSASSDSIDSILYEDMTKMEAWNDVENQPVIVISENIFQNNQAYLSGNAVYVRYTRQHYQDGSKDEWDAQQPIDQAEWDAQFVNWPDGKAKPQQKEHRTQFETRERDFVCGGGLLISQNRFTDNSPVYHATNGGSISIECDFLAPQIEVSRGSTTPRVFTSEFSAKDVLGQEFFKSMSDESSDFYKYRNDLKLEQLVITNNTFDGNEIGLKGSAIFARQVTNLHIQYNDIKRSQPAYSFRPEAQYYPYYQLLSKKLRPTLFQQPLKYAGTDDELDFLNLNSYQALLQINNKTKFAIEDVERRQIIDLPQVQGAIYVETCPELCFVNYEVPNSGCEFCNHLTQSTVHVEENNFKDNQDGFAFWDSMTLERASQIFSRGTHNINLINNKFHHTKNIYEVLLPERLPYFAHWLPDGYFESLQSPMIRLYMTKGVESLFEPVIMKIEGNEFVANHQVQPWVETQHYKGSLFQIEAHEGNTEVHFNGNKFDDNNVKGGKAALISIQGSLVRAADNVFYRSGILDTMTYTTKPPPADLIKVNIFDSKPWESYQWNQELGIFWIEGVPKFEERALTWPLVYKFEHNVFNYTFANYGAIYTQDVVRGHHSTYIHFNNNTYNHAYCLGPGIIQSTVSGTESMKTFSIHNHTDERLFDIQNGAYSYNGDDNSLLVYFYRLKVKDCFSLSLASKFGETPTTLFDMKSTYTFVMIDSIIEYTTTDEYWGVKPLEFNRYFENYSRRRSKPSGYLNTQIDTWDRDINEFGSIKLVDVKPKAGVEWLNTTKIEVFDAVTSKNITLWDMMTESMKVKKVKMMQKYMMFNQTTYTSFMFNTELRGLCGSDISAIYVEKSTINIQGSKFDDCYAELDADFGSTILLTGQSTAIFNNTEFTNNLSRQGGAVYAKDASKMSIYNSFFKDNKVEQQGGALMIEAQGTTGDVYIENSKFYGMHSNNTASALFVTDGSKSSVIINDTTFANNTAKNSLILLNSANITFFDSFFFDNTAREVTNGISASESKVLVNNTKIDNCLRRDCRWDIVRSKSRRLSAYSQMTRDLQSSVNEDGIDDVDYEEKGSREVLSGFFYMSAGSKLDIDKSIVKRTSGKTGSAIMLMTGSSLNVTGPTDFKQMQVVDPLKVDAAVIESRAGENINILNTRFIYNDATDLLAQDTNVTITTSQFIGNAFDNENNKPKTQPFIQGLSSFITIQNATQFYHSVGEGPRGIQCDGCDLKLKNYVAFKNLKATTTETNQPFKGSALSLINSKAEITNSVSFKDLEAYQGPAIFNRNSQIDIKDAKFSKITQNFNFEDQDAWISNNFYEVIPRDSEKAETLQPLLSVFWMECDGKIYSDKDQVPEDLENYCKMSDLLDPETGDLGIVVDTKTIQKGKKKVMPKPPPIIPPYLKDYSFEIFDADEDAVWEFREATEDDRTGNPGDLDSRVDYVMEMQSGFHLSARMVLLGDPKEFDEGKTDFTFEGMLNETDTLIGIISYINDTESNVTVRDDQKPNIGDYMSYSNNQTLLFENQYFRLKPNSTAYMVIHFDWQVLADTDNKTSVYAVGPQIPQPNIREDQLPIVDKWKKGQELVNNRRALNATDETDETDASLNLTDGEKNATEIRTDPVFYDPKKYKVIKFKSKLCQEGKFFYNKEKETCEKCEDGTKTTEDNADLCELCQENADCPDGKTYPKEGFVRMFNKSYLMVRCFNRYACSNKIDDETSNRTCMPGYEGIMCSMCQKSNSTEVQAYWKNPNTFHCYECAYQEQQETLLVKGAQVLTFLVVIYIVYKLFIRSVHENNVQVVAMIRILSQAFQFFFIVSKMQAFEALNGKGSELQRIADYWLTYALPSSWLLDFQCFKQDAEILTDAQTLKRQTQLSLVMIPALIIPLAILMILLSGCSRICRKNWTKVDSMRAFNRIFLMATIVTYFLLPGVVMHLISSTQCFNSISSTALETEEDSGDPIDSTTRRMVAAPDESCDGDFYNELFMQNVVPGLVVYGLLIPFLMLWLAGRKSHVIYNSGSGLERKSIESTDRSRDDEEKSTIEEEACKYKFGFLFSGYTISKLRILQQQRKRFPKVDLAPLKAQDKVVEIEMKEGGQQELKPIQGDRQLVKAKTQALGKQQTKKVAPKAEPYKPPGRGCYLCLSRYLYEPLAGDGVTLSGSSGLYEKRTFFYWEFIIFWQKLVLMACIYHIESPYLQGVAVLFVLVVCILMQLRNNVYKSARLARLHILTLMMAILLVVFKFLIYGLSRYTADVTKATVDQVKVPYQILSRDFKPYELLEDREQYIVVSTNLFSGIAIAYAVYFLWNFYVLFLVWLFETKSFSWFKVFTCCRWDLRKFARANVHRDAHSAGMRSAVVDGHEANIFPDGEFHIDNSDMENSQRALLNDSSKDQSLPLSVKKESDSATGSERALAENGEKLVQEEIEMAPIRKGKKKAIIDQLQDEHDPARRTSVASASGVVLLNAKDGEDLGPEADDSEKSSLQNHVESAKKRRQKNRDSATDGSKIRKSQKLLDVQEEDNEDFDDASVDNRTQRSGIGGKSARGKVTDRRERYRDDNVSDTQRSGSVSDTRPPMKQIGERSDSARSQSVSSQPGKKKSKDSKDKIKVEDQQQDEEKAPEVVVPKNRRERIKIAAQLEKVRKQKMKEAQKLQEKADKDKDKDKNNMNQKKVFSDDDNLSIDSRSDNARPSMAEMRQSKPERRQNIFHNQGQDADGPNAKRVNDEDDAEIIHVKKPKGNMAKAGDNRLNIFAKKGAAAAPEKDAAALKDADEGKSKMDLESVARHRRRAFIANDDDEDSDGIEIAFKRRHKPQPGLEDSQKLQPGLRASDSDPKAESSSASQGPSPANNEGSGPGEEQPAKVVPPRAKDIGLNIFKKKEVKKV